MSVSAIGPSWFALYVKSKAEEQVSQHLRYKGMKNFCHCIKFGPGRVRLKSKSRFFPDTFSAVSARTPNGLIITTPGVISIVGFGGKPMPVETREIEALKEGRGIGVSIGDMEAPHYWRDGPGGRGAACERGILISFAASTAW